MAFDPLSQQASRNTQKPLQLAQSTPWQLMVTQASLLRLPWHCLLGSMCWLPTPASGSPCLDNTIKCAALALPACFLA